MPTHFGTKLLNARHVRERLNISNMSLWRWVQNGDFPAPFYVRGRRYWRQSTVEKWFEDQR